MLDRHQTASVESTHEHRVRESRRPGVVTLSWTLLVTALAVVAGVGWGVRREGIHDATASPSVQHAAPSDSDARITRPSAATPQRTPGHERMVIMLAELRKRWGEHPYSPEAQRQLLAKHVAEFAPAAQRAKAMFFLGTIELKLGREQESIESLSKVLELLEGRMADPNSQLAMFWLGVAYLRMAETQNCCSRNTPDSCLLPIRGQGIHTLRDGSTKAIECLTKVLVHAPPDSLTYQNARWLMNIAHMTLGQYPQDVAPEYLLPPAAFAADEEFPRFMNIADDLGLNALNCAGGVIVDDLNGDGRFDVMVSNMDLRGQLRYWTNEGNGRFTERTEQAGLMGLFGGLNLVQADYNNDGHLDVLVLRGAWMEKHGRHPNSLLRNNGDGTFSDVTFDAGLGEVHYPTQTAGWADFDNDGDLDIYIGNENSPDVTAPSQLFRNNGDGTFTDIAEVAGVTNDRFAKAVVWGDYNQDRYPDIYVSNLGEENRLYRNNGDGTFTDVADALQVTGPIESFPAWFWDYDNDGRLDLYVSAYSVSSGHLALQAAGENTRHVESQKLYRADGAGGFEDVSRACGLNELSAPMGANFGDLDNDGYLDFYLGTGRPDYWELMPNVMYRNRGGKSFSNISTAGGFAHLQKGHGISFADLDHDGDQDIFSQMGGAFPGDQYFNGVFENPGFDNHFISVRLEGTQSNRCAIGARIRVDVVEDGQPRSIYRCVGSGGSFGANPLVQSIGIGKATMIEQIEVFWPTSGVTQRFSKVAADRHVRIVENKDQLTVERSSRAGLDRLD